MFFPENWIKKNIICLFVNSIVQLLLLYDYKYFFYLIG
jgi:hypothetical protein